MKKNPNDSSSGSKMLSEEDLNKITGGTVLTPYRLSIDEEAD